MRHLAAKPDAPNRHCCHIVVKALAATQDASLARLFQRLLHVLERTSVDKRTHQIPGHARIADLYRGVDLQESRHEAVVNGRHEQTATVASRSVRSRKLYGRCP